VNAQCFHCATPWQQNCKYTTNSQRPSWLPRIPSKSLAYLVVVKPVAFFDLDNTMVHGSSLFYVARRLMAEGLLKRRTMAGFAIMEARFVIARTESREHRDSIVSDALNLVRGHSAADMAAVSSRVAAELLASRSVRATLHALREHQHSGAETWLVTASPIEVARVIAEKLEMTGALATVPEIVDGIYTGRLVSGLMHGPQKAMAIQELARARGLDLEHAISYSDSANDLPMLSLTGRAAVVNANRRLRAIARARGWQVLHRTPLFCEHAVLRELQLENRLEAAFSVPTYLPQLLLAAR